MAIVIDKNLVKNVKNPVRNKEKEVFIGLKMPLAKSNGRDGYFESSVTSLQAAKENIRNLINTRQGERLFNPKIGLNLDEFLFENLTEEIIFLIREDITNTFNFWLPFVGIHQMEVSGNEAMNSINIDIKFYLKKGLVEVFSLQHIHGFSEISIRSLLSEEGFKVLKQAAESVQDKPEEETIEEKPKGLMARE